MHYQYIFFHIRSKHPGQPTVDISGLQRDQERLGVLPSMILGVGGEDNIAEVFIMDAEGDGIDNSLCSQVQQIEK